MGSPVRFRIKGTQVYVQPVGASVGYEAASQKPRLARWYPPSGGPNSLLGDALPTLRSRSRDTVRKNGSADASVEVLVSNIVGTGIKPRFKTPDAEFNRTLASIFSDWTDESDADGRLDFYGQQALAVRSMIEGGDSFARFRVRRIEDGLTVPFQVQVLESEYCPAEKTERAASGNVIQQGVEFDLIGRRVAYHLYRRHPGDYTLAGLAGDDLMPAAVPASEILHLALVRRAGMIRGEPWLTRALVKLRDLDKYDDAQLVRQQIAALFAGFVKRDAPDVAGDEDEVFAGQAAPDSDGIALAALEPGTMQMLEPGWSVDFSKPPEPGNSYGDFMRQQQLAVAASVGILYEQLTGDYSKVNDRTWRAAVNEFRRRCERWQHHTVVYQFCRPILARWAELAVLSGKVAPPAGITPAMIARAEWLPPVWPYINPVQDVQAKKDEMRAGLTSRSALVAEDGYDIEEVDRQIAADNERADRLGLIFDSDPRNVSNSGQSQADRGRTSTADEDPATAGEDGK